MQKLNKNSHQWIVFIFGKSNVDGTDSLLTSKNVIDHKTAADFYYRNTLEISGSYFWFVIEERFIKIPYCGYYCNV